jgi:hypothetical protein
MLKIFSNLISEKLNPSYIIRDHLNTFVDARGKSHRTDYISFFAIPLFFAVVAVCSGAKLDKDMVDILNSSLSLFAGIFLSVSIQLIMIDQTKLPSNGLGYRVRNEAVRNISFLIFLAILTIVLSHISLYDGWLIPKKWLGFWKWTIDCIVYFAFFVFLFTVLMVLKRTSTLFSELTN